MAFPIRELRPTRNRIREAQRLQEEKNA